VTGHLACSQHARNRGADSAEETKLSSLDSPARRCDQHDWPTSPLPIQGDRPTSPCRQAIGAPSQTVILAVNGLAVTLNFVRSGRHAKRLEAVHNLLRGAPDL
jgi:hypothetical protein